jgi:hypothetical protein
MSLLAAAAAAFLGACTPSLGDRRWLYKAQAAWRGQLKRIPEMRPPSDVQIILFDRSCRFSSANALDRMGGASWRSSLHGGRVLLGDGSRVSPKVLAIAGEGRTGQTFVMALPSIWRAQAVASGPLGLDTLTTAVLLHEASHVAQPRLMARIGALVRQPGFGRDFDDDSIQRRFERNAIFAGSIARETRLLFAAAEARDDVEARRLTGEAAALIRARRNRWFTGANRRLGQAEDLFLSMEGAGQYVGYSWLTDPQGAGLSHRQAMAGFGARPRWWSQAQGLALVLAVKRLGLPNWREQLWGEPALVGVELLEAALRNAGSTTAAP